MAELDPEEYKQKVKELKPTPVDRNDHEAKGETFLDAIKKNIKTNIERRQKQQQILTNNTIDCEDDDKKCQAAQKKQQIHINNTIDCEHEKPGPLQHCLRCLLKREYGESHLFNDDDTGDDNKEALFIPSFFVSGLYGERTSVLDHNIKLKIEEYKNKLSKDYWLKEELSNLVEALDSKQDNTYHLDPMQWAYRMKVLYLLHKEQNSSPADLQSLPSAVEKYEKPKDLDEYIKLCFCENPTKQCQLNSKRKELLQELKDNLTSKQENQNFKCDKQSDDESIASKLYELSQKLKEGTSVEESLPNLTRSCAKYCKAVRKAFDRYLKDLKNGLDFMMEEDPDVHKDSNLSWLLDQKAVSNVFGDEVEYYIYQQLKKMGKELNNFVIIHSLELALAGAENGEKDKAEFDYLLFSAERKLIITIEAKRSLYRTSVSKYDGKAFNQLWGCKKIIEQYLGDCFEGEGKKWTFIPMIFTFNERDCEDLPPSSYVVSKSKLTERLETMINEYPEMDEDERKEGREQLKQVLSLIIFVFHISKKHLKDAPPGAITSSKWVSYTMRAIDTISTKENIIFYSTSQLSVFMTKDDRNKKVVIVGEYGSGKSLLLKEKANLLLKENEDVLYLFGNKYKKKTLLQIRQENEWENNDKITVLNVRDLMVRVLI